MTEPVTYPHDWEVVPIKALGDIKSGGTPSRSVPAYWNGTIPWVTPTELTGMSDKYLHDTRERITQAGLAASAATLLPPGSLLVTTRATIGSVAIASQPVATNQGFKNIVPAADAVSGFYYYCLQTLVPEMLRRAIGSTFQEISKSEFERIAAPRPPKDEQTAIASILDTVDDAIRQTAAVIEKLKKIKAGLLHNLLTRGIDEDGQLRDPIRYPEQFRDSPLGNVPNEWEVKPLGMLADIRFSSVDKKSRSGERRVRLCNYIDAYNHEYLTGGESFFMVATATEAETAKFALRDGDIVVTKDSETPDDIGIPCVITSQPTDLVCGYHLALIRPDGGRMNSVFLAKQLRHSRMARYFGQVCNGLTRYGLPTSAFSDASILVPPLPEQNAGAGILRGLDARLFEETRSQRKLTLMKQGLMQDLLTGRVRVPIKANGKAGKP
jgi:type I restriction enzyme S subunit